MNLQASTTTSLERSGVIEPVNEPQPTTSPGNAEGDWVCAWCLHPIANDKDRFRFEGQDEFTFINPEKIRFEIMTFCEAPGASPVGLPTLEHTWFPGHAWSYCQCDGCHQHLGWFYKGHHHFAGLIRNRILRADCIKN